MNSARVRARYVLPTPVGPRKTNDPIGRFGSFKSARERRRALLMAVTASYWPMTRCFISLSIMRSFCVSSCSIRWRGTPVTFEMMCIMSSAVTTTCFSSRSSRHLLRMASSFSLVCFVNGRRLHLFRLVTAFQRCVFLDVLAVFVHRGRADTLQFATTQRGLDDVRCVHRPFGRSCADNGVQLVDKKNHALGTADFVHYGFDALFELAAVFCSGDHQRQIE